jgi:hypothetical protein
VDTLGLLVAVLVTTASVQDRAAVPRLLARVRYRCPRLSHLGPTTAIAEAVAQAVSRILRFTIRLSVGSSPRAASRPASSLGRGADLRLDAPLPTPHPPVRADPTGP